MSLKKCLRMRPTGIRLPTHCVWFIAFLTKAEPSCRDSAHQGSRLQVSNRSFPAFFEEFSPCGVHCEISVSGRPRELRPAVQEQINLIGREALVNALLHSTATRIEAEVEYSPRRVRVLVRDNGCGIDPCAAQAKRESHWGLLGMRERAESIGARLTIWSRPGAGTEVEISVPSQALAEACA